MAKQILTPGDLSWFLGRRVIVVQVGSVVSRVRFMDSHVAIWAPTVSLERGL